MPEGVKAVLDYLFRDVKLDAVLCGHFERNVQSARVQQKCGFHFLKKSTYTTRCGTVEQSIRNILYRSDWEAMQPVTVIETELTSETERELLRMSADWAAENSCRGYYPNDRTDLEGNRIFFALAGSTPVGYLLGHLVHAEQNSTVMAKGTPFFEVEEIYITPAMRSRGIGAMLFRFAENAVGVLFFTFTLTNWEWNSGMPDCSSGCVKNKILGNQPILRHFKFSALM
mgnify:CR=1 FL=1